MKWAFRLLVVNLRFISIASELPSLHNLCFVSPIQFCESDLLKISLQSPICFCESNLLISARRALRNRADCLHVRQTFSRPSNKTIKIWYQPFCWAKKKYLTQRIWNMHACNITLSLPSWWNLNWLYSCSPDETLLQWQNLSKYEDNLS